jgi:hypothetical protein
MVVEAPSGFPQEVNSSGLHPSVDFWDFPSSYGEYILEGELVDVPPADMPPVVRARATPIFHVDRYYPRDRAQFELWTTHIGLRLYLSWMVWLVALVLLTLLKLLRRSKPSS